MSVSAPYEHVPLMAGSGVELEYHGMLKVPPCSLRLPDGGWANPMRVRFGDGLPHPYEHFVTPPPVTGRGGDEVSLPIDAYFEGLSERPGEEPVRIWKVRSAWMFIANCENMTRKCYLVSAYAAVTARSHGLFVIEGDVRASASDMEVFGDWLLEQLPERNVILWDLALHPRAEPGKRSPRWPKSRPRPKANTVR